MKNFLYKFHQNCLQITLNNSSFCCLDRKKVKIVRLDLFRVGREFYIQQRENKITLRNFEHLMIFWVMAVLSQKKVKFLITWNLISFCGQPLKVPRAFISCNMDLSFKIRNLNCNPRLLSLFGLITRKTKSDHRFYNFSLPRIGSAILQVDNR